MLDVTVQVKDSRLSLTPKKRNISVCPFLQFLLGFKRNRRQWISKILDVNKLHYGQCELVN